MDKPGRLEAFWSSELSFSDGETRVWRHDGCRFWIERRSEEWRIAFAESDVGRAGGEPTQAGEPAKAPTGLAWRRFVTGRHSKIAIRPMLPDRPVVVKPDSYVFFPPGHGARYYLRLPLWLAIEEEGGGRRALLVQHPVTCLRSTWFGEPHSGELCYAFPSLLARKPEENPPAPFTALCPVAVRNEDEAPLDLKRICLRVQYLSLYLGASGLATNEALFHYHGLAQQSQISFREEPPDFDPTLRRITAPRVSPSKSLFQKSFEYIKSLTVY